MYIKPWKLYTWSEVQNNEGAMTCQGTSKAATEIKFLKTNLTWSFLSMNVIEFLQQIIIILSILAFFTR